MVTLEIRHGPHGQGGADIDTILMMATQLFTGHLIMATRIIYGSHGREQIGARDGEWPLFTVHLLVSHTETAMAHSLDGGRCWLTNNIAGWTALHRHVIVLNLLGS
jgi:hypothetical protein